jgi:putative hydrolase of HD superfamily
MSFTRHFVDKTVDLARMLLSFGLVERVTHHEDGVTKESDATHTVMLGIMACAFAREHAPHLDTGKIAQFALVHDLVEVYAGDTNTFAKEVSHDDKETREKAALERIREEFIDTYPWIAETIEEYETLASPEARYVKVFDKVLPKLSHLINGGVTVSKLGHTTESLKLWLSAQTHKIETTYGQDQEAAVNLYKRFANELQLFVDGMHT